MKSLISCVVPTYNGERYIAQALESILSQTYGLTEVIVADDGSTDGTRDIVRGYGERVSFVAQATSGPAMTRNLGLEAATGDFVAFLDADDLWHADKLAIQADRFEAQPKLDLCITYVRMFWEGDVPGEEARLADHPRAQAIPGYATTTLLARRAVFDKVGKFNPDLWFADATEWFLRAAEQDCALEIVPQVLVFHRMHATNLTRRRQDGSRAEYLTIVKASLDRRRQVSLGSVDESEGL